MTNANCIRVLSVDDHPLFREGVGAIINSQADMSLVGTASNGKEGIETFRILKPEVTLMDLRLRDLAGLDVMIAIRSEFRDARVIVLTTFEGDIGCAVGTEGGGPRLPAQECAHSSNTRTIRQVHAGKKVVPAEIAAGLAERLGDEALLAAQGQP
jgi:DNA-binding NarL/FixJ family response regulator